MIGVATNFDFNMSGKSKKAQITLAEFLGCIVELKFPSNMSRPLCYTSLHSI